VGGRSTAAAQAADSGGPDAAGTIGRRRGNAPGGGCPGRKRGSPALPAGVGAGFVVVRGSLFGRA
jgi:hypothetical protein